MCPPNSKKCPYSGYVIARNYEKTLYLSSTLTEN